MESIDECNEEPTFAHRVPSKAMSKCAKSVFGVLGRERRLKAGKMRVTQHFERVSVEPLRNRQPTRRGGSGRPRRPPQGRSRRLERGGFFPLRLETLCKSQGRLLFLVLFYKDHFLCYLNFLFVACEHLVHIRCREFRRNQAYERHDYKSADHCDGTAVNR